MNKVAEVEDQKKSNGKKEKVETAIIMKDYVAEVKDKEEAKGY